MLLQIPFCFSLQDSQWKWICPLERSKEIITPFSWMLQKLGGDEQAVEEGRTKGRSQWMVPSSGMNGLGPAT